MDTGGCFPRNEVAGTWNWPLPPYCAVVEISGIIYSLPHTSSWHDT
jgi:hypothetical protein